MKICPQCGATARGDLTACPVDGAPLAPLSTAMTLPAGAFSAEAAPCPTCGASLTATGVCAACAEEEPESTFPGRGGARVGDFTLVRSLGEGALLVRDTEGRSRVLAFGQKHVIADERAALSSASAVFPTALAEGYATEVGHYVVLTVEIDGAVPVLDWKPRLAEALSYVRAVVDAAAELEARGFTWEPAPTDLYVAPGGGVIAVRARTARRRGEGERLNAKRVLESLGEALLPWPVARGTPAVLRLLVPRWNFSTLSTRTIESVRDELASAERAMATRSEGSIAVLCDPGLRRHHNEDAVAFVAGDASGKPFSVLVVCDGVSSSTHAERASAIASTVARDALREVAMRKGGIDASLVGMRGAITAAHVAICAEDIDYGDGPPAGTTIVAALVHDGRVTFGWVGDSRAYWVPREGSAELCTTDHSWVNEVVASGEVSLAEAMASPLAHALTKCLGPLDRGDGIVADVIPEVRERVLVGKGHLVLCTDGLWNYFPTPAAFAELVREAGDGVDPSAMARFLVCRALAEGGGDNVSVAVLAID